MVPVIADASQYNRAAKTRGWHSLCDVTLRFLDLSLAELCDLWKREAGRGIATRAAMSPRVLKNFLRDIVLYERIGEGDARRYRVRLMGTSVAQIVGDMTGKLLDEAVATELLPRWYASLDATLGMKAPLRFLRREDTNAMSFLTGEFFSAPLIADDGQINLVLAGARYSGQRPWEDVDAEVRKNLGLD